MSLQEASGTITRLARYEVGVVAELPEEDTVQVEVNGVLAGVVRCLPDAPVELAIGWAFMHGFFGFTDPIDAVSVHGNRVSLMVETSANIDARRKAAVGWIDIDDDVRDVASAPGKPFAIHGDVLIDLLREVFRAMAQDRSRDGFVHAAVASDTAVHCVARDATVDNAVAKIVGWMLRDGRDAETPILVVRGMVDRAVIKAAANLGVSIVATSGIPTADAFRLALGQDVSILGMATNQRPGLLVDAGHVVEEDEVFGGGEGVERPDQT
jgi:formate dehydrogenase accessory protein FdhD